MTTTTTTIKVNEIHCAGCENAIRTVLGKMPGVTMVRPDAATSTVQVIFTTADVTEADLRTALDDLGYPPADA
jgi:copper chaperone CopZ